MIRTHQEFVNMCREKHHDKYQYKQRCHDIRQRIAIECPIHGVFYQIARLHLRGDECPHCKVKNEKEFVTLAVAIHGLKYNYDNLIYTNWFTPVTIYCTICLSYFTQNPSDHIDKKDGCKKCKALERRDERIIYNLDFNTVTSICGKCRNVYTMLPIDYLRRRECQGCTTARNNNLEIEEEAFINSVLNI